MLVETINKYQDRDNGKVYEIGDLRDVPVDRGHELIRGGVAVGYTPIKDKPDKKGKGKKEDIADKKDDSKIEDVANTAGSNGTWETPE